MAMASEADFDISQLSADQQEALQQYTALTNQEVRDAVPLLQRSQWNVQIAITKFFDGEGPDPVAEAIATQEAAPRVAARHENLQESLLADAGGYATGPRVPHVHRTDVAPRIVPQPSITHRPPFLLALFFAPFNLGYKFASTVLRSLFYLLSFLPRPIRPRAVTNRMGGGRSTTGRRQLAGRDNAARFRREFEEQYGAHELSFFEGSVAEAYDLAKRDLKFLLMVLISPEHDDTDSFVCDTLLSPEVTAFAADPANNVIVWGGNVLDSEAYQVSHDYNCTKFPFSALICLTPREGNTRMGVIKRLAGPMAPATYMAEIQAAINKYAPDLDGVRAERAARAAERNLRTEQDSAYERSLARDRERARQKKEAAAAAAAAEKTALEDARAAAEREDMRRRWRQARARTIAPEPETGAKDVVRLALKMPEASGPGGGRILRRFAGSATVEELYAFVECYDLLQRDPADESELDDKDGAPDGYEHEYKFRVASIMPREVYEPSKSASLAETIGRSGNLIVEEVSPESEGEEEEE